MTRSDSYPGSIDRRPSGSWRWRVMIDGRSFSRTKPAAWTEDEVADFAREEYGKLREQVRREQRGELRLTELLDRYESNEVADLAESSQTVYGYELTALRTWIDQTDNDPLLRNIGKGDVRRFLDWRKVHRPDGERHDDSLSGHALDRSFSVLRRALEYAFELELIDGNPARRLDAPDKSPRQPVLLSKDQLKSLLTAAKALDDLLYTYIVLVAETGLRTRSEALWLRWEDLDMEDGFVAVVSGRGDHDTKTKTSREVPLSDRARETLRDHAARYRLQTYDGERSPWVFHLRTRKRDRPAGSRRKTIREAIYRAADDAELPERWIPYDLRHQRCTRLLAAGENLEKVSRLMGHKSLEMTRRYSHLVREDLRDLVTDEPAAHALPEIG